MAVGIALGVLVGTISGAAFTLFVASAFGKDGKADPQKAGTSLLSMPATWFGGGWLTTIFDVADILSAYVTALAITTVAISAIPLMKTVVRVSNDIGRTT
jgi:hypothetical protein